MCGLKRCLNSRVHSDMRASGVSKWFPFGSVRKSKYPSRSALNRIDPGNRIQFPGPAFLKRFLEVVRFSQPVPIAILGGQIFDLCADQSEEGLDNEHQLKVEQPIVDVLNRPVIDAVLEETESLGGSEPLSSVSADGSTFEHGYLAVRSHSFESSS